MREKLTATARWKAYGGSCMDMTTAKELAAEAVYYRAVPLDRRGPNGEVCSRLMADVAEQLSNCTVEHGHRAIKHLRRNAGWTDERVELLKRMWNEGQSASKIAKA